MTEFTLGLYLMLYGLIGVFATLIVFFAVVKIMAAISKKQQRKKAN